MRKVSRLHVYAILILALFAHLTVLNHARLFNASPDLMLILVVLWGLFLGRGLGLEAGVAAGLLLDIFSLDIFWTNTLILGSAGVGAGFLNTKFFKESKATQVFIVFSLALLSMLGRFACGALLGAVSRINFYDYLISSALPVSAYTAVVSIPVSSKFIDIYHLREPDEDLI